ncbi:hypothetical protein JTE90_010398 [Oedothorax gibbosus]|uniref:RNase H type-1 domain-containing protein n=1 Tax=Oedothorax gibbosus TaxID=931172 RepID=A0AAV6VZI8_9ARAC|nr:hypothetical protein JTE90_010398 [Oedothorax gibbosus]
MAEVTCGNSFSQKKDLLLDASQVLAAALEQMDDILAATNQELYFSGKDNSSVFFSKSENEAFSNSPSFNKIVPDSKVTQTNPTAVNSILENLKDYIEFKENSKYDFPYNHELDLSSAKVVLNWLQKELKEKGNFSQNQFQEVGFYHSQWTTIGYMTSRNILHLLVRLSDSHSSYFQWVLSHVGLFDNESADDLAKDASMETLHCNNKLTFSEIFTIKKLELNAYWRVPSNYT